MWILRLKGLKMAKTVYEKEIDVTYQVNDKTSLPKLFYCTYYIVFL